MVVRDHKDLEIWQVALELVVAAYRLSGQLPSSERFGLKPQIQRAAVSIPSNIAEGHARSSKREYLRFLSIARGSLAELETQVLLLTRLGFVTTDDTAHVMTLVERVAKMLNRLRGALMRQIPDQRIPNPEPRTANPEIR